MKPWNKIILYTQCCIKIAVDAIFLMFWSGVVYVIHIKFLPLLGLTGYAGIIINGIALLFDAATGSACVIYIAADLRDDFVEFFVKNSAKKEE